MKKILYLSFYFEPDLSAGSFRNTTLVKELANIQTEQVYIDVFTTQPNRYHSFKTKASTKEENEFYTVNRIKLPGHQNGMLDQIKSFTFFYKKVLEGVKNNEYDLVVASSSRLFTAYLGYKVAKRKNIPLYLDVRDIFVDTMEDVLQSKLIKNLTLPVFKHIENSTFSYAAHINLISKGFKPYFSNYKHAEYSYFPNGIDEMFINDSSEYKPKESRKVKNVVYAGNIGEGQGLHKILPTVAKKLKGSYHFTIIGDGGAKDLLEAKIKEYEVDNISLAPPVKREELFDVYNEADFLFVHLNDYDAFKKVLPSKIFELAAFPKPIIAGVSGYARAFLEENVENVILFQPCNEDELVQKLKTYNYNSVRREKFIEEFSRKTINKKMSNSILSYL